MNTIPVWVYHSREWASVVYLFLNHEKLNRYAHRINFDRRSIPFPALHKEAKPWSETERFVLNLAHNLFNPFTKKTVELGVMVSLDANNFQMVMKAIAIRYGHAPIPLRLTEGYDLAETH